MNSDKEMAINVLQSLANSKKGKTKTGRLRELLPQIEATHTSGVSLETILDALNEQGFDLTYKVFATTLWRLRKRAKKDAALVVPGAKAGVVVTGIKAAQVDINNPTPVVVQKKPGDPKTFEWDLETNQKQDHWK